MKKIIVFSLLALVFFVCSCSMPTTTVRTVDDRPTLAFKGAPEGALLYIDGLSMGTADQYNGEPTVLTIEPGTHTVRVTVGNETIYEQRIFVESSLKTITLR
jgi:uncharacterized membrane protein